MKKIDECFFSPRTPVSILNCNGGGEAYCIRDLLENMGCAVTMHLIGTPGDLFLVLEQGSSAPPYSIISGHGDENGLIFGEFGPNIVPEDLLKSGSLQAKMFKNHINLPDQVILSTACRTGSEEFGDIFLKSNVRSYIAPNDYPSGADALMFIHLFFYQLLCVKKDVWTAFDHAHSYNKNTKMFQIFSPPREEDS